MYQLVRPVTPDHKGDAYIIDNSTDECPTVHWCDIELNLNDVWAAAFKSGLSESQSAELAQAILDEM
jgi:hypothetical protein